MRAPAYHLRPNKAVDRLIFMDAIRWIGRLHPLNQYTYYGLGGPYLEDFRMLYEMHPEDAVVSIERDREVYKRQQFHLPCATLQVKRAELSSFISRFDPDDHAAIFWLDYTNLRYSNFEEFSALLQRLAFDSLVKITLRAEWKDFMNRVPGDDKPAEFRKMFAALMPDPSANPPINTEAFAALVQSMLRTAVQRALPAATGKAFQPICTFYYSDGTFMFTSTGVVCARDEKDAAREMFQNWKFASLHWAKPKRIDVPTLTTKERLLLQEFLPCESRAGRMLRGKLGYLIDDTRAKTDAKLRQYAQFHRYYPYVMRAVP